MSYCRWSCDDFKSDVYVYECVDDTWTTHIAGNRIIGECPPSRLGDFAEKRITAEEMVASERERRAFLDACERVQIDLPHAGETFKDGSAEECMETLLMLRGLGYHVPEHAIAALREEISGQDSANAGSVEG